MAMCTAPRKGHIPGSKAERDCPKCSPVRAGEAIHSYRSHGFAPQSLRQGAGRDLPEHDWSTPIAGTMGDLEELVEAGRGNTPEAAMLSVRALTMEVARICPWADYSGFEEPYDGQGVDVAVFAQCGHTRQGDSVGTPEGFARAHRESPETLLRIEKLMSMDALETTREDTGHRNTLPRALSDEGRIAHLAGIDPRNTEALARIADVPREDLFPTHPEVVLAKAMHPDI